MILAFSLDALSNDIAAWAASTGRTGEALLRLLLAAGAGGLVGLEREVRGRLAGFRTNLLVCLGSALVMIVSIHFALIPWAGPAGSDIQVDPARIAYGVMTGIGFLGAGTIMQSRGGIRGLTTAAALWCVAAIGLGMGLGLYLVSILGALLVVVALWILDYVEAVMPKKRYRRVTIRRPWKADAIPATIKRFNDLGFSVHTVTFEREGDALKNVDVTLGVSFLKIDQMDRLGTELQSDPEVMLVAARE